MAKVAFIGLGVMGYPMAGFLKTKGGHEVTVYNRTTAKAERWAEEFGGSFAATPREAAEGCDFVFACVGNDADLRSVTTGVDGAFHGLKSGAIFMPGPGRNRNLSVCKTICTNGVAARAWSARKTRRSLSPERPRCRSRRARPLW